jgi:hypothetical protein
MARRGRFTNPNSGGQNLTALITALLREKNSAEEQAMLNAYRTGTAYNGAVPTAGDIQAFYDEWARNAGYAPGTLEYQAIVQKKSELNNYDIKKQYNTLITDFNNSSGANYDDIMDFLENEAGNSSDPQDLETYQGAISDINKSYIGYQGEALGRGEITAAEYRALAGEIIAQMDPEDPKRYETIVNAYTYEWNAEKTKWDNRLLAGTINANQYANWAKGFQNALLAAGVKKDSVLYTTAVAAQVTANSGGGVGSGSVVKARIDTTLTEIDTIVDVALSLNPSTKPRSVSDILASGKDSLGAMTDDPALILLLGQALDENPNAFPTLSALGITDSSSLNVYVSDRLTSGQADSYLLASNGGADYTQSWFSANVAAGGVSEVAQFDFQSTKWLRDIGAANGNVATIQDLNNEWTKYLSGQDSKYGKLDETKLGDFLPLAQNEYDAMTGRSNGTLPTLSGTVNSNIPLDFTTVRQNTDNLTAMRSGNGYQQWSEKNQEFEFVSGRPAGSTKTGSYQFVEFAKVNGEIVSYVTSVQGTKVSDKNGRQIGWVYDPKNGSAPIISNLMGQLIETPEAGLNGSSGVGFVLPDGASFNTSDKSIPLYSTAGLETKTPVTFGANSRNEIGLIRSGIVQTESTISPDDLRVASGLVANVIPALGGDSTAGSNISTDIVAEADAIQIGQISASPSAATPEGRAEIARLSGNTDLEKAWLFIAANQSKLEVVGGGWKWKAGTQESTQEGTNPFGTALAGAGLGAVVGAPIAGIGAIPGAIGGGIAGFVQGALGYRQSPTDLLNDYNRQILNNDPSMEAQRLQYYYTNNWVGSLPDTSAAKTKTDPGNLFFRNIDPMTKKYESFAKLNPVVVNPMEQKYSSIVQPVNPMTQKYESTTFQATPPVVPIQPPERRGGK